MLPPLPIRKLSQRNRANALRLLCECKMAANDREMITLHRHGARCPLFHQHMVWLQERADQQP